MPTSLNNILTTIQGVQSEGAATAAWDIDPYLQPAYFVMNNRSWPGAGALIFNHQFECIGKMDQSPESYAQNRWDSSYGDEFGGGYRGYSGENGSSSGNTTFSNSTPMNTDLGHTYFRGIGHIGSGAVIGTGDNTHATPSMFGAPMGAGITHKSAFVNDETRFGIGNKSLIDLTQIRHENTTYQTKKWVSFPSSLFAASHNAVVGGMMYNQKNKWLVVMEKSGYNHRPIIIKNMPDPDDYINNAEGYAALITTRLSEAGMVIRTTSYHYKPTNQGGEDQSRGIPVLCDDGTLYYTQAITNWGYTISYYTFDGDAISANVNLHQRSWTTMYGWGNDRNQGGMHFVLSNDGTKIRIQSNAYYYHSGFYGVMIDILTGRCVYDYYWHSSAYSRNVVPIQKDSFIVAATDANNDNGPGGYYHISEFEGEWRYAGRNTSDAKRRNATSDPYWAGKSYMFNTPYHSTHYSGPIMWTNYDRKSVGDR